MIEPELEMDTKKYNRLEPTLHKIMKSIALPVDKVHRNQDVIYMIVEKITDTMSFMDVMFSKIFQRIFYGGSFFDRLKLKNPDEFDLDLVMTIPKLTRPSLETSEIAGFVQAKLSDYPQFKRHPDFERYYRKMDRFVDGDNYLLTRNFLQWFESLLIRALTHMNTNGITYDVSVRKSGPALTLEVIIEEELVTADLVPSFIFNKDNWPHHPFRRNPVYFKPEFLIVPKPPKNSTNNRFWRLSFQEQERELIHGKNRLKDSLKLLKHLRDEQNHSKVASYYLKTVVLWMCEKVDSSMWSSCSLSYNFMMVLKYYKTLLDSGQIPYFWNENNNLLGNEKRITLQQWSCRLKRIINDIERNLSFPDHLEIVLCDYFGFRPDKRQAIHIEEIEQSSGCVIL